ncbi:MAG: sulfotransferase [Trueperaceae bacterium]|nr:sulfotransferase [Trueperaceae bacterium]
MSLPSPLIKPARTVLNQFRLATAPFRGLPDFLIIGAQKAGTSSLFSYLDQHPAVKMSRAKEVHYFDLNYAKGETWYRSFFALDQQKLKGEASPYYLFHPHVAKRIKQLLPEAKLLVLLRNPTERALSQYFHAVRRDGETLDIQTALETEEERIGPDWQKLLSDETYQSEMVQLRSYKKRGLYLEQLERYWEHFAKEQILVLSSEAFFSEPNEILKTVYTFLGLTYEPIANLEPQNIGSNRTRVAPEVIDYLNSYFAPFNKALFESLGQQFDW